MFKHCRFVARRAAFLSLSALVASSCAFAQNAPAVVPDADAKAPALQSRAFPLRNIKASLAAFWLDSKRYAAPFEIEEGRAFKQQEFVQLELPRLASPRDAPLRLPGNGLGPDGLKLPAGVETLVANDPQNTLLATGTADGLAALERLMPAVDVPLVQFEVEAHFYALDLADLKRTGLKFEATQQEFPQNDNYGSAAPLPAGFEESITKLVTAKSATLSSIPPFKVIDGLGTKTVQTIYTPALTEIPGAVPVATPSIANPVYLAQTHHFFAYISTSMGLRVAATRLPNDLISLEAEPHFATRALSVDTIVRDGQPFAIALSRIKDPRQIIFVVTMHRIREAGTA